MGEHHGTVFAVDDNIENLKMVKTALGTDYDVFSSLSAPKMFELMEKMTPDLVILDINMPEMDGFEALLRIKSNPALKDLPVMYLSAEHDPVTELKGLEIGAVDFCHKPFLPELLRKRIDLHMKTAELKRNLETKNEELFRQKEDLRIFNQNLKKMVAERTKSALDIQHAVMGTVADMVESRDRTESRHVARTQMGMRLLLGALKLNKLYEKETSHWDIDQVLSASELHDIGKIAIRDGILLKPGPLEPPEFKEMQKHTTYGVHIIENIEKSTGKSEYLDDAKVFAASHHEKWDGTGYPAKLAGENIPLHGRLLAIVDVYDTLTHDRVYKKAVSHEEASATIIAESGKAFEPQLVDLFKETAGEFAMIEENCGKK